MNQAINVYHAQEDAFGAEAVYANTLTRQEAQKKSMEILHSDFVGDLIDQYDFIHDADMDFEVKTNDKRYKRSQANDAGAVFVDGSRSIYVVIHEIAHALTINNDADDSGHGPEFAFCFLQLVKHFLGRNAGIDLSMAFMSNDVNDKPKGSNANSKPQRTKEDDELDQMMADIDDGSYLSNDYE